MALEVELVSWESVYDRARTCARQIESDGFRPDLIVAIARGGFAPARILCDFLDIHDLASLKVEHYGAGAREKGAAKVVYPLNAEIGNLRVLLADDVNDSGETLIAAQKYLEELGPAEVRIAVLDQKTHSPVEAHYQGRQVREWRWITYPWAVIEDLSSFVQKLPDLPNRMEAVRNALYEAHGMKPEAATIRDVFHKLGRPLE